MNNENEYLQWPKTYTLNAWGITISDDIRKILKWSNEDELSLSLDLKKGTLTLGKKEGN